MSRVTVIVFQALCLCGIALGLNRVAGAEALSPQSTDSLVADAIFDSVAMESDTMDTSRSEPPKEEMRVSNPVPTVNEKSNALSSTDAPLIPVLVLPPVWWSDPEIGKEELPPEAIFKFAVKESGHRVVVAENLENCFSESCVKRAARQHAVPLVLFSAFIREDSTLTIKLGLYDTVTQTVRCVREAWKTELGIPRLELLQTLATDLLEQKGEIEGGTFQDLPWLVARPERETSRLWVYAAPALGTLGAGFLLFQGQLLQRDQNSNRPSRPLADRDGAVSYLPSMFSGFTPSPRLATFGGGGAALAEGAEAMGVNPAGVASGLHTDLQVSRATLPDGTPELSAAFVFPSGPGWAQGYSLKYRGDALADETVLQWAMAADFGWWSPKLKGWRAGLAPKLLLAKIGDGGVGVERSTGHSVGASLDAGLRIRLSPRIEAAVVIQDPLSFIWNRNTYTNETYGEILPPRLRLGASCIPVSGLIMVLDGDKALIADQADHVRMGLETAAFKILRLRAGVHEAFGRETIRKASLGFGISNSGLENQTGGRSLQIDYGYEFGIEESGVLSGGHRFGLKAAF